MKQNNNWDSYRRKQINIDKAVTNDEVSQLFERHYKQLCRKLIKTESDKPVFNDTFLKMTHCYNPDKDYIEQYIYYFNLLKGAYYRDDKVTNYLIQPLADNEQMEDIADSEAGQTESEFIANLYANIKEADKANKQNF